jgi:hypothetical protein
MKNTFLLLVLSLVISFTTVAQKPSEKKITISGKVIEKGNKIAVEYATVSFKNITSNQLYGAMTDATGLFTFEVPVGDYTGVIELMSYKKVTIPQKKITENTYLGAFALEADISQLQDVDTQLHLEKWAAKKLKVMKFSEDSIAQILSGELALSYEDKQKVKQFLFGKGYSVEAQLAMLGFLNN